MSTPDLFAVYVDKTIPPAVLVGRVSSRTFKAVRMGVEFSMPLVVSSLGVREVPRKECQIFRTKHSALVHARGLWREVLTNYRAKLISQRKFIVGTFRS